MRFLKINNRPKEFCPTVLASQVINNEAKLLIIRALLNEPLSFNEIKRKLGFSSKTLWINLEQLEDLGVIVKVNKKYKLSDDVREEIKRLLDQLNSLGSKFLGDKLNSLLEK